MKFNEFVDVVTLIDKNDVKSGTVGTIIHRFTEPCEGYEVEFGDEDGYPWAMQAYKPDEIALYTKNK